MTTDIPNPTQGKGAQEASSLLTSIQFSPIERAGPFVSNPKLPSKDVRC